ncbi:hypothetical protein D1007_57727 [Hordeum vulgare]|nr:hypothetical protein D1007_57727 [Hordeum vulgare]
MAEDQTAQEAWTLITNLFLDNQMTRAVYLEAEFRGLVQGDLSVTAYCHRLKALSDALGDVGTPSPTRRSFSTASAASMRASPTSLPSSPCRAPCRPSPRRALLLTLRETQLANSTVVGHQTALYSGSSSHGAGGYHGAGASYGAGGSNTSGQNRGDGNRSGVNFGGNRNGGGNWRKKKNSGGSNTSSNSGNQRSNQASSPVGPWVCFNPYTGQQLQASPTARQNAGAGLLGSRPPALPPRKLSPRWLLFTDRRSAPTRRRSPAMAALRLGTAPR